MGLPDLSGSRAKLERAVELLNALNAEAEGLLQRKSHNIIQNADFQTGWNTLRPEPIQTPDRWSVILGEIVHDTRSALDHLVWQLVLAHGQQPGFMNQFPIHSDRPRTKQDGKNRAAGWRRSLNGMSPEATAFIKRMQPYQRRNRAGLTSFVPLELLADLSNIDKHRTLVTTATVALPWTKLTYRLVAVPAGVTIAEVRSSNPGVVLPIHETELVAIRFHPPHSQIQVKVEDPINVGVGFGEGGRWPLGALEAVIDEVRWITEYFARTSP